MSRLFDRWRKKQTDSVDVEQAHTHASRNRPELERSSTAGCFHCLGTYDPSAVTEWSDDDQTAVCPECGSTSVIGDAAGYPLNREFLGTMNERWFGMA
jgi:hypothetical protein